MKWFILIIVILMLAVVLPGCTEEQFVQVIDALAKMPFVDRTEKEINDWFDNTTVIDDKPWTSGTAVNGEP